MSAELAAPSKILRGLIPHLVLIAFSASILLPLVWLLRVALTDKLTAYRIPPELAPLRLDNFVEIFVHYNFSAYFLNSIVAAVGSVQPGPMPADIEVHITRFAELAATALVAMIDWVFWVAIDGVSWVSS